MHRQVHFPLILALAFSAASCSSADLFLYVQGNQYEKCDKLANAEDRRRCRAETYPDYDKYERDRRRAGKQDKEERLAQ